MKRILALAALSAVCLSVTVDRAVAQSKELRFGLFIGDTTTTGRAVVKPWIEHFNKLAGGQTIKLFAGGTLGKDPTKQYKLVNDGVADIVFFLPGYLQGQFPEMPMFELPGMARDAEEGSHVIWQMFKDGKLHGFDDIKVVSLYASDPAVIHGMVPLKKIEDLKGLKVRVAGAIQKEVVEVLGGIPVGMPVNEISESLTRGVVQATLIGWTGGTSFRVPQTATTHLQVSLGFNPFLIAMNKKVYEGLSAQARKVVDESGDLIVELQSKGYGDEDKRLIKEFQANPKMTVTIPSAAEEARIIEMVKPVHDSWIKANGREAYDAYASTLKAYRAKNPGK